jgi:transposase-like protein
MMDIQAPDLSSSTSVTADTAPVPQAGGRTARRLSAEQEQELARLYAETRTSAADLARQFGISQTSLMRIAQRHGATRGGQRRGRGSAAAGAGTRRAGPRASAARQPRAASPATQPRRRFRVRFVGEQVVEAADIRQAVARAEALGAVEISGITAE